MNKLQVARDALAKFEQNFGTDSALGFLAEGLDVLDEVANENSSDSEIARQIGRTYFDKACSLIASRLSSASETEPTLEAYINILREFEGYEFCEGEKLSGLKVESFIQWFNSIYQGYTPAEKNQIIEQIQRPM